MPDRATIVSLRSWSALIFGSASTIGRVARLSRVIEDSCVEERRLAVPSQQVRRYVEMLRAIEREPEPRRRIGALRSLERMRNGSRPNGSWKVGSYLPAILFNPDSLRLKLFRLVITIR